VLLLLLVLTVQLQQLQPGVWQLETALQLRQQLNSTVGMTLPAEAHARINVSRTHCMWLHQRLQNIKAKHTVCG
jgi:hypothetical protein